MQISAKFQINIVMNDVSNMANAERFSNIVLPMLWFDISMEALPQGLNNRFIFYLNMLPGFVKFCYYGCLICGPILLIWACIRVTLQLMQNFSEKRVIVLRNLNASHVYSPCEEKRILAGDEADARIYYPPKDTLSQKSSSGISSADSGHRSLHDDDLTELRIVEENEIEPQFSKYRRQHSSFESISTILDQI